ncbi:ATP-binding protein [Spirosoma soli]|uniref:histidine kinase n=1 Tax=Spirosoma soli TaxID=1770529 RepID=A0ABW5LY64_9BACT
MSKVIVDSVSEPLSAGLPQLDAITNEEQVILWQQTLHHSVSGLVGLVAVRNDAGQIVDFRYLFINQIALRDTLGAHATDQESIPGRLLTEFYPSIRETPIWQSYINVLETGEPHRLEQHYKLDNRDISIIQSASSFGPDKLLLSYAETSDLHLVARRVTRQSALLNGVLNSSPNAIVVFDATRNSQNELIDFHISLVNRMFETITNHDASYFAGTSLTTIYPIRPKQFECLRQLIETGTPFHFDEYVPAINRWLDITLTRLNDGFVATIQDVTTQRQVQQQLEATVQELHRSNQNLEQFAYVASHDLQEPLRKIVSFGDVLTDQFADGMSESAADLIRRMQRSAGRMRSLVQDLLTYARLAGDTETFGLVDLNHLLLSIIDDLEITIQDRRATVQLESLPAVWGDASLLRQLFQNLMSNALKFQQPNRSDSTETPHVLIRGRVAAHAELPAAVLPTDASQAGRRYALIKIIDNGIGFDERYLDRIFTIFQRLHGRMEYSGTGMGLAICKKVVDIHKGHITAISQEGAGATFIIYLPMQ